MSHRICLIMIFFRMLLNESADWSRGEINVRLKHISHISHQTYLKEINVNRNPFEAIDSKVKDAKPFFVL